MVEVVCGDPWKEKKGKQPCYGTPATYTRFILPFIYNLQPFKKKEKLYYSSPCQRDLATIQYFTSETANVLYHRATWATISGDLWKQHLSKFQPFSFKAKHSKLSSRVGISPPTIVLFEGKYQGANSNTILQQGFLILEVFFLATENHCPSLDDLLEFNEYFRFTDSPFPQHAHDFHDVLSSLPADFLNGKTIGEYSQKSYSYLYKNRWLSLLKIPLNKDGRYYSLVPENLITHELLSTPEKHINTSSKQFLGYADNRTFVWSCAILPRGASSLKKMPPQDVARPWEFGHWLRLLNVDQPCDSTEKTLTTLKKFEKEWLKEKTYQRWAEDGTFYGYCYHSGAMLGPPLEPPAPPLWYHFGQMYFDQILLLFYLRITLFAFSHELTRINQEDDLALLRKNFKVLRQSFAKFTNLYQFPLISNQQQGLEMYELARKSMDIDILFNDVRNEITSTHEYLEMEASSRLASLATFLAALGIVIALLSIPKVLWGHISNDWIVTARAVFWLLLFCLSFWSYKTKRPIRFWDFINNLRR